MLKTGVVFSSSGSRIANESAIYSRVVNRDMIQSVFAPLTSRTPSHWRVIVNSTRLDVTCDYVYLNTLYTSCWNFFSHIWSNPKKDMKLSPQLQKSFRIFCAANLKIFTKSFLCLWLFIFQRTVIQSTAV